MYIKPLSVKWKALDLSFLKFLIDKTIVDSIPSAARRESVSGLKSNVPAIDRAVTNSGEVTNAWVAGLASFLPVKFLLYEVTMVFFSPFATSFLSHWPMHGPHALAKTTPPICLSVSAYKKFDFKFQLMTIHVNTMYVIYSIHKIRHPD